MTTHRQRRKGGIRTENIYTFKVFLLPKINLWAPRVCVFIKQTTPANRGEQNHHFMKDPRLFPEIT